MNNSPLALLLIAVLPVSAGAAQTERHLSREVLLDKIRGAWAGQMVGVAYGARTEFKAKGRMFTEEIKPEPLTNALGQDDLYVEMTFARVLDTVGLDATSADFGAAFKDSQYDLWHANAAARRNLNRGLAPPLSGSLRYNPHADDIDFQIEADFIGIMCPGLPQASNRFCDRVGRVMNAGDGLYGGMFVAGMYAAAFFEDDPRRVVEAGLACIPADSRYARLVRDVLQWSGEPAGDWTAVWRKLTEKWDKDDPCPRGALNAYNIDAKLNGGFIALGLLLGRGDWQRTMEIATRCGQDSDCNPSSAAGVLGAMLGFNRIPEVYRRELAPVADAKFQFTAYSFNDIVKSTEARALKVIAAAGGQVTEREVLIPAQGPKPPPLEQNDFGVPAKLIECSDAAWTWQGSWQAGKDARTATGAGSETVLRFEGTGLALVGPLSPEGGRADVFVDGTRQELAADAYTDPKTHDNILWHAFGLAPGPHTLRLVVRDDADARSRGRQFTIRQAVVYANR